MSNKDVQIKILAQAIYELKHLLDGYLGSTDKKFLSEAVSAHLTYALHNEALAILENRPEDFDIEEVIKKIGMIDERYGKQFNDRFQEIISKYSFEGTK